MKKQTVRLIILILSAMLMMTTALPAQAKQSKTAQTSSSDTKKTATKKKQKETEKTSKKKTAKKKPLTKKKTTEKKSKTTGKKKTKETEKKSTASKKSSKKKSSSAKKTDSKKSTKSTKSKSSAKKKTPETESYIPETEPYIPDPEIEPFITETTPSIAETEALLEDAGSPSEEWSSSRLNLTTVSSLGSSLRKCAEKIVSEINKANSTYVLIDIPASINDHQLALIEQAIVNTYAPTLAKPEWWFEKSISREHAIMAVSDRIKIDCEAFRYVNSFARNTLPGLRLDGLSEKEAFIKIEEYICDYLSYANSGDKLADAVNKKTGICWQYAQLTRNLCFATGIDTKYAVGWVTTAADNHAWIQVKLNGRWYWSDPCWDDVEYRTVYQLSDTLWSDHILEALE